MKGIVSNYGQVRQSKFQTEQEVSGSISPPEIKTADCQNKDGLRLMACQDVLRLETPSGQLVAVQSKVEDGSGTFYLGGATLYLARHFGLVDIIEEGAENVISEAPGTADSRV